jgi:hypothetical protein
MAAAFPGTGDQGWLAFIAPVPLPVTIKGTTRRREAGLGFVNKPSRYCPKSGPSKSTTPMPCATIIPARLMMYVVGTARIPKACYLCRHDPLSFPAKTSTRRGGVHVAWYTT